MDFLFKIKLWDQCALVIMNATKLEIKNLKWKYFDWMIANGRDKINNQESKAALKKK